MSSKNRWLISLATVSALTFLLVLTRGIVFETVDDVNVMYSIAGYKTGSPYWQLTFYNSIYAFLISIFYRITGAVSWYALFQFLSIFFSFVTIMYVFLEAVRAEKENIRIHIAVFSCLYISSYMYIQQRMQFTTTSAILGAAGLCLMYLYTKDGKRSNLIVSGLFVLLSCLNRRLTGLICVILWAGLYAVNLFLKYHEARRLNKQKKEETPKKPLRKKLFAVGVIAVTLTVIGGFLGGDIIVKWTMDNKDYMNYDKYRGMYQDYKKPAFAENEDLYASIGWDKTVYELAQSLVYIDPAFNEESFKTIVTSDRYNPGYPPKEAVRFFYNLLYQEPAALIVTLTTAFFAILAILALWHERSYQPIYLIMYALAAWVFLIAYLSLKGRLPLRVMLMITLPPLSLIFVIAMSALKELKLELSKLSMMVFPVLIALAFPALGNVYIRLKSKDSYSTKIMADFIDYATEHPENVYIHDYSISNTYNSYSPFKTYADKKPTNVIISGGSYTFTGCYYEQLRVNGLEKLDGETLFDNNVYFVCDLGREPFPSRTMDYLLERYENANCVLVDTVSDEKVGIFKFIIYDGGENPQTDDLEYNTSKS